MATITQTFTSILTRRPWTRPPDPYEGPIPFSEVTARSSGTILALGAGDVGVYSFSTVLPRNYAYRLVELQLEFSGTAESELEHLERGMEWVITENQVTVKRFLTKNVVSIPATLNAYQARNPAITNDFVTEQEISNPLGAFTDIIDASEGQSVLLGVIVDPNPTTTAIGIEFRARFLSYTVLQLNAGAIWTPMPVVS